MIPQEVIPDACGAGVASGAAVPLIAAVESGNKDISFSVSEGLQPDLLRERLVQRAINGDRHFKFTVHESTTFRRQHTTSAGGGQSRSAAGGGKSEGIVEAAPRLRDQGEREADGATVTERQTKRGEDSGGREQGDAPDGAGG